METYEAYHYELFVMHIDALKYAVASWIKYVNVSSQDLINILLAYDICIVNSISKSNAKNLMNETIVGKSDGLFY